MRSTGGCDFVCSMPSCFGSPCPASRFRQVARSRSSAAPTPIRLRRPTDSAHGPCRGRCWGAASPPTVGARSVSAATRFSVALRSMGPTSPSCSRLDHGQAAQAGRHRAPFAAFVALEPRGQGPPGPGLQGRDAGRTRWPGQGGRSLDRRPHRRRRHRRNRQRRDCADRRRTQRRQVDLRGRNRARAGRQDRRIGHGRGSRLARSQPRLAARRHGTAGDRFDADVRGRRFPSPDRRHGPDAGAQPGRQQPALGTCRHGHGHRGPASGLRFFGSRPASACSGRQRRPRRRRLDPAVERRRVFRECLDQPRQRHARSGRTALARDPR